MEKEAFGFTCSHHQLQNSPDSKNASIKRQIHHDAVMHHYVSPPTSHPGSPWTETPTTPTSWRSASAVWAPKTSASFTRWCSRRKLGCKRSNASTFSYLARRWPPTLPATPRETTGRRCWPSLTEMRDEFFFSFLRITMMESLNIGKEMNYLC